MPKQKKSNALFEEAIAFTDQQKIREAITCYEKLIQIQPNHAIAYNNLGILYNRQSYLQKAEKSFKQAININPHYANAWFNWGNLLKDQEKYILAIEKYQAAITHKPLFAEAYNNMGECLGACDQFDLAIKAYQAAIQMNPELAGCYFNLGNLYYRQHQFQLAIDHFKKSIAIQPDYKDAHFNLSFALFMTGDYINGFKEYEWRLKRGPFTGENYYQPFWDGNPAPEKTVFVYCEQGFGDNFQFCRYLPLVAKRIKKLIFGSRTEQGRLFKTILGVDQVIIPGEKKPEFDYHCSLLSLPHLFQTHTDTIPCEMPYLFPDILQAHSELDAMIEQKSESRMRVGIVWGGNTDNKDFRSRHISLALMSELFSIPGISWFSFQKGPQAKELLDYNEHVVDLSIYVEDFYDTAIGLSQMDLLVTVDTSVAHLAGALGIPVWILVRFDSDWRWSLEKHDSPWYPTCLLFRQKEAGNWQGVVDEIRTRLQSTLSQTLPPMASAYYNDGVNAAQQEDTHQAVVLFQKALSINPQMWHAAYNLSVLFAKKNMFQTALLYARLTCRLKINKDLSWLNLGKVYYHLQDIQTAIQCLQIARTYNTKNIPEINYELGKLLLTNNQWEEGKPLYEYRKQCKNLQNQRDRQYSLPEWDGKPFKGKSLLLYYETGIKDIIVYIRFLPLVKQLGGTVILETPPGMYRLVLSAPGVDRLFYSFKDHDSESETSFDIQASLKSLPYLLNIPKEAISHQQPYIQAPQKIYLPLLKAIQANSKKINIGIAWYTDFASPYTLEQYFDFMKTVFELDHLAFFIIGFRLESNISLPHVTDLSCYLDYSYDLASVIPYMDLIITTDNAIGHLAGAMCHPVFMVLAKSPEWYWQMTSQRSDWYPDMTLFRQSRFSDDHHMFQAMADKLLEIKQNRRPFNIQEKNLSSDFYLHAIGYFDGSTGYHVHTRSFMKAMSQHVPILESEMQLERLDNSIAYMHEEIIPQKKHIVNIAIQPIHWFKVLKNCPGIKIAYVVWETTRIPDDWLNSLAYPDYLWTPSHWGKQVLEDHGIQPNRIHVVPEGVDGQTFCVDGPCIKKLDDIQAYKFLYVGKLESRKATGELIVTFDYTFRDNPHVRLMVCAHMFKKDFDFHQYLLDIGVQQPHKIIRVGPFAQNEDLAALYRSCDAFVLPTRAEGWGLPIIEAMACGLPTIVTGYSGLTEFATKENAYFINYKLEDIDHPFGLLIETTSTQYGQWAEPDFEHLGELMKYLFNHPEEAKKRGQMASREIHSRWTWNHAAQKAMDIIEKLV